MEEKKERPKFSVLSESAEWCHRLGSNKYLVPNLGSMLIHCVSLGKSLILSRLPFLHLEDDLEIFKGSFQT